MNPVSEVYETDDQGRVALPDGFANTTVTIERTSDEEVVIRKAGAGLPPLPHVRPLSDRDRDTVLSMLDNPPPPNAALRKLMAGALPPKPEPAE